MIFISPQQYKYGMMYRVSIYDYNIFWLSSKNCRQVLLVAWGCIAGILGGLLLGAGSKGSLRVEVDVGVLSCVDGTFWV